VTAASWTFVGGSGGAAVSAGSPGSGTGDLSTRVDLPAGASATFSVTATIDPAATGQLVNTASVSVPAGDSTPDNNTAHDTDTLMPQVDVGVTKDDGTTTAVPGQGTTYTIVVTNTGPGTAINVLVSDPLPAGVTAATWSGNGHSGTGALSDTIASL